LGEYSANLVTLDHTTNHAARFAQLRQCYGNRDIYVGSIGTRNRVS
jgi:hypothetical protein